VLSTWTIWLIQHSQKCGKSSDPG